MCSHRPREELAITRSERWMDFHTLRMQGLSIRKIAALRGVSRNAVRRALRSSQPPNGEIPAALGKPVESFSWEDYPAMEQLTISTWNVFDPYQGYARPFDFLTVGIISQDRKDIAACPKYCCKRPRPSCFLFDDPSQWRVQEWRCLSCGAAWDFNTFPRLRTYGELLQRTLPT